MKKRLCMLMVLCMTVGLFAGCGGGAGPQANEAQQGGDTQEKTDNAESTEAAAEEVYEGETYANGLSKSEEVTLKIAIGDRGNGTVCYDATIELFESMYPNVKIEATKSADIESIIETKIAAGDDEDMFDIIDDYKEGMKEDIIAAGKLEMLDDLWEYESNDTPGATLSDLTYESWKNFSYVGGWPDGEMHVANFPHAAGGYSGLYFNRVLFEEKGWNQDPQTWQEFLDLCADIKADGVTPLVFTGVYPAYLDGALIPGKVFELAVETGELEEATDRYRNYGEDYYTNDSNTTMWKKLAELGAQGYWHTGMAGMNHTQAQMQVIQGNVAMVMTGSWVGNEMADSTPEGFTWGFMTMPMRETEDTPLYVASTNNQFVSVWSAKPELNKAWAKEFIRLMWDMSIQEAGATAATVSIRKDFADDPERLAIYDDAISSAMGYAARENKVLDIDGHFTTVTGPSYAQASQLMYDSYVDMILGNVDIDQTLGEAEEFLNAAKDGN